MSETHPGCKENLFSTGTSEDGTASSQKDRYDNVEQDFDTGVKAWLQVLGSFFLYFNSW